MLKNTLIETVKRQLKFTTITVTLSVIALSCNVDKVNPAVMIEDEDLNEPVSTSETVLFEGQFMNGAHPTSGKAQITLKENGTLSLVFLNFKTDSGPDLRVYLAEDNRATGFIEISREVKNGNVKYNLPAESNPEKMDHVLIWCKAFSVNFGSAVLEKVEE